MVNKQNVEDITGLSPTQEGMLFHYLKDPSGRQYFEQLRLDLSGQVDTVLFEKAWNDVAAHNDALRTVFRWEKLSNPVQITLKEHAVVCRYHDCTGSVEAMIAADKEEGFDLSEVPFRVTLIKVSNDKFVMLISNHHILYDGWSNAILLKEFFNAYEGLVLNTPVKWQKKPAYKQFITAIRNFDKAKHQAYWSKYLDGFDNITPLPFAKKHGGRSASFLKHTETIAEDNRKRLKSFLAGNEITLASLVYAVWGIVLSKCVHSRDIVFGVIVSGRKLRIDHIDNTVGLFINTVPVRFRFSADQSLTQVMQQVAGEMGDLKEYENTPLVEIREYSELRPEHDLFHSIVVVENYPLDRQMGDMKSMKVDDYSMDETTNYGLTITIHDREKLEIEFKYDPSIFGARDVQRIAGYFLNVLNQVIKGDAITIGQIDILHEDERRQVLELFNQNELVYDNNETVISLFEKQVENTPDAVAVNCELQNLTYSELNERANQFANYLRSEYDVKPGVPVGIRLERTEWMIVVMLAVLKSGGAYVPLDPAYPQERIEYMTTDSGCVVVIDEKELDKFRAKQAEFSIVNPVRINAGNDLAYIIYTSGSTGRPKGVMIEHKNVTAFLHWCRQEFANSDFEVVYAATSICFDLSVYEIFFTLTSGKKIKLLSNALDIAGQLGTKEKVLLNTVPGVIGELLELKINLEAVTVLNMAGEPVPADFIDKLPVDRMEIRNLYGPTEDTTYSTVCRMQRGWQLSIGKPKANTSVYILDEYDQPCAIGVSGEICISGQGLARGYMNRSDLTNEKFVSNPFCEGERMYRTGDLGYWMNDGTIAYVGRADNQLKIRGYRIEPGEIEQVLQRQQGIKNCIVMALGNGPEKFLCAYVIAEEKINIEILQANLSNELPAYMLPQQFVQLDQFPLTANGKIDRKSLPMPRTAAATYIAPADDVEEELVKIWSELLNIAAATISTSASFFELGGHSLKATRLVSRIHKAFEVKLPLTELFRSPRLNELASYIRGHVSEGSYETIPKAQPKTYYRLSPAQERMFILQQLHPAATGYNMPVVFPLPADSIAARVEAALKQLISRHEILRTSFEVKDDVPVQCVHEAVNFKLDVCELDVPGFEALQNSFVRPFGLDMAPLFRAAYVQVSGKHYLLADMHHIISDGVSQEILEKEFMALYKGEQLPPLQLQYKDYSEWMNSEVQQSRIKAQEQYWVQAFAGELPVAELPYDHPRPAARNFEGSRISIQLTKDELHTLHRICNEQGVTPYMFLLSVINIWLSKLTGDEDVIVLSPVAARRHEELENIIGLFVNTLALRSYPEGQKSYADYLREVKQCTLQAYEHQEYGFESLVDKLQVRRDLSRNPLSDVMFVLQNQAETRNRDQDYREGSPLQPSKFDITITGTENPDGLLLDINYSTQLFTEPGITRLVGYMKQIIQILSTDAAIKIKDIQLVGTYEKKLLLNTFNGPKVNFPQNLTITQLFEEQAAAHPDSIAVVSGEQRLTYRELNELSNQLAAYLRQEYDVQPDDRVGMLLNRSEWMIVTMLAVLKSGGAYVPIDPSYPTQRIEYMIADSDCVAVIDEKELKHFRKDIQAYTKENLDSIHDTGSLAYVIYTSGTTGKPKGSLITHTNVVRLLVTDSPLFNFGPEDVWTFFHSYCFDFSVWEMYGALLFGGKLVMIPSATAKDSAAMLALLQSEKVTVFNQTPSSFYNIIQESIERPVGSLALRYVVFGGEALRPAKLKAWHEQYPGVSLINMYGITETTVHVTYKEITLKEIEDGRSNIGKPIPTLSCYVLDKWGQLVPPGVFGELYVGGDGVARGYLNREELTAQRFLPNPFETGERLYRSGDKARWLSSGDLEYGGRLDEQVKIRGYRIELAEIERALLVNHNITEAVVLMQPDGKGEPCLVAYLTAKEKLLIGQVKEELSRSLPDYMLPLYYLQMETLPLTSNGKLDKKSLPLPKDMGVAIMHAYIAPRTAVEKQLAGIWSEVLGYEKDVISIESNFFEIGGHSLKAYTLTSRIHKEFDVRFPLAEIFRTSTIRSMSEYIMALDVAKKKKEHQPIKKSIVKI